MSNFEVVLAPEAESDITDALVWYRKRSVLAAVGFRVEVFGAIDRIGEAPLSWPIDEFGNRQFVLRRFPFSVVYDVEGRTVTILAVAHHRRRPDYWRASEP